MRYVIAAYFTLIGIVATLPAYAANVENAVDFSCVGCNVIFLDIDLLRADSLRPGPSGTGVTPNIDEFFRNSIYFEDTSSSSGVTAISNTATLTAREGHFTYYLLRNTFVDVPPQMPEKYLAFYGKFPTIAETLAKAGYDTINANHGWYAGKQMLLNRGFATYWGTGEPNSSQNEPAKVIRKTAELIRGKVNSTRPFFLLMRSEDLRGIPYRYPVNRKRLIDPKVAYLKGDSTFVEVRYQLTREGKLREGYSSTELAKWMSAKTLSEYKSLARSLYSQQLLFVDEELGKLFDALKEGHLLEKTIVVLYANHGDGLYDNGVPNHGVSYQSCVSVPLMILHPKVKKRLVISTPIQLIDLVPTIFDFLGTLPPSGVDRKSLQDVLRGTGFRSNAIYGVDKESQYVRLGKLKLIVWADRSKELYDLSVDPSEETNVADQNPQAVATMESLLAEHSMEQIGKAAAMLKRYRLEKGISD